MLRRTHDYERVTGQNRSNFFIVENRVVEKRHGIITFNDFSINLLRRASKYLLSDPRNFSHQSK